MSPPTQPNQQRSAAPNLHSSAPLTSAPNASLQLSPPPPSIRGIIHLFTGTEGGGIITTVNQWAPLFIAAGWPMSFVLLRDGKAREMLESAGQRPIVLNMGRVGRWLRLPRRLRRLNTSIIHVHNPSAHLVGARAARAVGAKLVRTVHADMFEEMRGTQPKWKIAAWQWAMKRALRRADRIICVSPHLVDRLPGMNAGGVHANRVLVCPNGYDPSTLARDEGALPDDLRSWLADGPLVISLGRLVAVKNYAMLLRAWARVSRAVSGARLILAGAGPMRESLESLATELNITASFRLLSWVDHIAPLMRRATLAAISSHSECCPMLVLEAYAVGKPVIATKVGGLPSMVTNDRTGFLIEPGADQEMAHAILDLLSRPDRAAIMGAAGRADLLNRFSHRAAARTLADIYADLSCPTPRLNNTT